MRENDRLPKVLASSEELRQNQSLSARNAQSWTSGSNAIGASLSMAVAVALFGYGGHRLDGWWGTRPWFLLLGCSLGVLGGFIHLIKALAPDLFAKLFLRNPPPIDGSKPNPPDRDSD